MNESQMKICLFGGTFDPIHLGHTFIAHQAVSQLGIDKVIFLPCKQSPHKLEMQSATAEERLKMCQLATSKLPWAEVSDYDLTSPPPSYSWRTAEHFKSLYPNAQLFWLMGTDQWQSISRWDRAHHFANLLRIIVYSRDSEAIPVNEFESTLLNTLQHPAAATVVRQQIAANLTSPWLHPQVASLIKKNQLYLKSPLD
ncbi:nicotinate (nicotinamide) nucleotide adenylyltransferase [Rubritalea profundi]|uniref:Probable nicotinate-nucleotide adenylyltransferase n=1 Tax=Rubritalea profundi TaxID=1658618 RepID=A0A2S7U647_9BACT|nr:nicotinate (nicotinamide) nucleotide adenylyltransferase [Rubritalea profundi]PQJ29977.1 nicotinate (nicotinamide) nucleotide adenylyltransferase [Rubritalea profundi]